MEVKSSLRVLLFLVLLCCLTAGDKPGNTSESDDDTAPYLIFASARRIYRMFPNGTGLVVLVQENNPIFAVDYHYRMDYLFWTQSTLQTSTLKRSHLNGSGIATIMRRRLRNPGKGIGGLAVDWINDKLYWTDRSNLRIDVYDLHTSKRSTIVSTGAGSLPLGLAIYPYPGHAWVFWVDIRTETLQRATVEGDAVVTLHQNLRCVWPLTMDYYSQTVYWADYCNYQLESAAMDGSGEVTSLRVSNIQISYGIALFEETLFWTQSTVVLAVNKKTGGSGMEIFRSSSSERVNGIKVVHPSKQPAVGEFLEKTEAHCRSPCVHGACVGPDLCLCDSGWRGAHCSIDEDECQTENGGCDHNCTNLPGTYACSCLEGYNLDSDNRTCNDIDECKILNGGCEHICINRNGTYVCSCYEGFILDASSKNCTVDIDFDSTSISLVASSTTVATNLSPLVVSPPISVASTVVSTPPLLSTRSPTTSLLSNTPSLSSEPRLFPTTTAASSSPPVSSTDMVHHILSSSTTAKGFTSQTSPLPTTTLRPTDYKSSVLLLEVLQHSDTSLHPSPTSIVSMTTVLDFSVSPSPEPNSSTPPATPPSFLDYTPSPTKTHEKATTTTTMPITTSTVTIVTMDTTTTTAVLTISPYNDYTPTKTHEKTKTTTTVRTNTTSTIATVTSTVLTTPPISSPEVMMTSSVFSPLPSESPDTGGADTGNDDTSLIIAACVAVAEAILFAGVAGCIICMVYGCRKDSRKKWTKLGRLRHRRQRTFTTAALEMTTPSPGHSTSTAAASSEMTTPSHSRSTGSSEPSELVQSSDSLLEIKLA